MPIRPWAVGIFVIVGLGLFGAILYLIGDRQKAFSKNVEFDTSFSNLNGLAVGAKVRVSGLDAGKVKTIDIPKNVSEKFRLRLEVEEKVHGMIHTDSIASIETDGVVGDKFLLIKRGSDHSESAPAGALLPGKEPFDLSAVMDQASGLLKDVHATVGDVRGRADAALDSITKTVDHADEMIVDVRPNIHKIARDGGEITANIRLLTTDLNAGKGPAGLLFRDEDTRQQLQTTLSNAKDASQNLNDATARANQLVGDFQSRELVEKAQATLENVQAVSEQLNMTMSEALSEDSVGEDAASNIRQTLGNLNRSTANLADDTEALKHNFFFRGFFKKRGFFNLDHITPAEYREACVRNKQLGSRLWLSETGLMTEGYGMQDLSPDGRHQIDATVAPVLDKLSGHLVMVEGYSSGGSTSDQFASSRRRADQVRRYLEAHYHLRHSDVGIVALSSTPPQNAGRASWDGAAIMLLEEKTSK